ncbi:MAG TPA: oligosaccharide flippase family protein [Pyrinomonadaceae bacterium]|nr:oligosaccharide flippase family protein [Pyrinomonadaceae bacterium]
MATASVEIQTQTEAVEQARKPARGLTRKAYLNAFSTLLDYGAKVVVLSIVTPILVSSLGRSLFGVWQMLSRLVSYMSAADGRPTQALKWVIAHDQAVEDDELKRRHVGSALGVWLIFLPVITVVGLALVWVAPVVTKVPEEMYWVIRLTFGLLVVEFLVTNLAALPESVLRGMNLGYKRMGLQAGLSVVGGVLTVAAVYAGAGLVGLAGAQVILGALTGVLYWVVVKKYVPWFGVARPRFKEVRSFLKLSVWWFAWSSINRLLMASDIIVLGVVASASAVTTYALTSYSALMLLQLTSMLLGAATPGLGGVVGQRQFEKAARLRTEMMRMSWLMLTATGAAILLVNRSFVNLWVGPEHYAGFWPNLLIVLVMVQFMFIRNDAFIIDLTLQMREKVILGAVAAVISIGLSAFLIPAWGITGLCLGMMAGRLILTVSYPLIVSRQLEQPRRLPLRGVIRPALVTALVFAASGYLGQSLVINNWFVWLLCGGASFGLALGVALFTGLNADARGPLVKRLMMVRTLRSAR